MHAPRLRLLAYFLVFCASILVCMVLWRVYPYGFIYPDSAGYLSSTLEFHLWEPGFYEAERTPLVGIVFWMALHSRESTVWVYWFNALCFSLTITLVCRLGMLLWKDIRAGIALGLSALAAEVWAMNVLMAQTAVLSDPMYINALLMGSLLSLCGIIGGTKTERVAGALLLGVASLIRPLLVPLLLWSPFFAIAYRRTWKTSALLLALLLLPTLLWSARNQIVYRSFAPSGLVGVHIMTHIQTLIRPEDRVFDDPTVNRDFHETIRTLKLPPGHEAADPMGSPQGSLSNAMLAFYTSLTPRFIAKHGQVMPGDESQLVFEMSRISTAVAWKVIRLHPLAYLAQVWEEYQHYYDGKGLVPIITVFSEAPQLAYRTLFTENNAEKNPTFLRFYPPHGTRNAYETDMFALRLLRARSIRDPLDRIYGRFLRQISLAANLAGLTGLLLLMFPGRLRKILPPSLEPRSVGLVLLMLFLNTALHYLLQSAVSHLADLRYALTGKTSLHLLLIAWSFLCIHALVFNIRRTVKKVRTFQAHGNGEPSHAVTGK